MAFTQNLNCAGCGSYEEHVHLTKTQEEWLRTQEPGLTSAESHTYWKCTKKDCRTLRHRWQATRTYTLPPPEEN
ncbi:hypothetical protein ABZY90_15950 [Streptomyces sp. NPDC006422]|uniref:hypothetical protein n=1 Tax=unclassified Streptomyces TaxID=2593676 RepID=UPI0033A9A73E